MELECCDGSASSFFLRRSESGHGCDCACLGQQEVLNSSAGGKTTERLCSTETKHSINCLFSHLPASDLDSFCTPHIPGTLMNRLKANLARSEFWITAHPAPKVCAAAHGVVV